VERAGTVIVGGGISGLACARRLHEAGHPFLLVTDRLGGRTFHRPDGSINFGATYLNEDYRHVSRFVGRGIPFRLREAYCENDGRLTTLFHWHNLRYARSGARLVLRLRQLRAALLAFRRDSEQVAQRDLLPHHPLIARYARQPAPELVGELGLRSLHERYFKLAFQATCFVDPDRVGALFYLGTLFPVIVRTWVADFTGTYARLVAGFEDRVILGVVTALSRNGEGWSLATATGRQFLARRVVIAVPYHNASKLYPVPQPYLPTSGTILAVRGERRPLYRGKRFVLLHPEANGVALVWRQACGEDLVFGIRPDPDLTGVFESPAVTGKVTWKTAVVVSNGDWSPSRLEPGLFLAGDYNLCGMEDAYLSGLCAANLILKDADGAGRA
jgi:glycine/D-amino acid oxidase-like deaminating enzyme